MSKRGRGGRNHRSFGGSAGGGGGGGNNRQGKVLYDSGSEPAFIRQFKERTGYKAPATTDDKRRPNDNDFIDNSNRPRDGDYYKDDEKPQIVQLSATDLSKEEVDIEVAKLKEAEEERKCVDATGRVLFRKPKEKSDEATSSATTTKCEIVDIASSKSTKRKIETSQTQKTNEHSNNSEKKKTKTQLLSFMDEEGVDGDD